VFPAFVASQELTIPAQGGTGNTYYSSTLTTNGGSLTTFQIDNSGFSGNLQVQGSSDATAYTVEWYDVDFEDLHTGNLVSNLSFANSTTRFGINVEGYHPYVRLVFDKTAGNISLIQYR